MDGNVRIHLRQLNHLKEKKRQREGASKPKPSSYAKALQDIFNLWERITFWGFVTTKEQKPNTLLQHTEQTSIGMCVRNQKNL